VLKVTECVKSSRIHFKIFSRKYKCILNSNKGPHKDECIFKITGDFIKKEITLFFFPIRSNNLSKAKSPNIYNFDILHNSILKLINVFNIMRQRRSVTCKQPRYRFGVAKRVPGSC
jgi:hypothetical protein